MPTVHPRAGGEHHWQMKDDDVDVGSSPRGRGTHGLAYVRRAGRRFIPARAGNTRPLSAPARSSPVHPRAGGEHMAWRKLRSSHRGSSPRGRGTPGLRVDAGRRLRFIPARAGNTRHGCPRRRCRTVHPRAGGEHAQELLDSVGYDGSSPRGRGTQRADPRRADGRRFIPARAGNTTCCPGSMRRSSVHPRAGGEHVSPAGASSAWSGSSPRGRGTPLLDVQHRREQRFIPARAGNTKSLMPHPHSGPVHPRAGGEHRMAPPCALRRGGSSPRGRGTPAGGLSQARGGRFIPARAGNTRPRACSLSPRTVHPRAGGEHPTGSDALLRTFGSSPRGRGTHLGHGRRHAQRRFIPARAGNTP